MARPRIPRRRYKYASNRDLRSLYSRFNALWFNDKLPSDTIVKWASRPTSAMGTYNMVGGTPVIELDPSIKTLPRVIEWVMLHEQCHALIANSERSDHGPKWKAAISRLVRRGAYAGLF